MRICTAAAVYLFVVASASAQAFNIDFSAPGFTKPSDAYGAAAGQPGFWNRSEGSFPASLTDLGGVPTSVTVFGQAAGTAAWPITGGGNDALALMGNAIYVNATSSLHFNGLASGFYTVYLYSCGGSLPTSAKVLAGVSSFSVNINAQVPWSGSLQQGTNYIAQNIFVPADDSLTITFQSSVSTPLNGLQLVPIPTPGVATFGLSTALLACSRRRRFA